MTLTRSGDGQRLAKASPRRRAGVARARARAPPWLARLARSRRCDGWPRRWPRAGRATLASRHVGLLALRRRDQAARALLALARCRSPPRPRRCPRAPIDAAGDEQGRAGVEQHDVPRRPGLAVEHLADALRVLRGVAALQRVDAALGQPVVGRMDVEGLHGRRRGTPTPSCSPSSRARRGRRRRARPTRVRSQAAAAPARSARSARAAARRRSAARRRAGLVSGPSRLNAVRTPRSLRAWARHAASPDGTSARRRTRCRLRAGSARRRPGGARIVTPERLEHVGAAALARHRSIAVLGDAHAAGGDHERGGGRDVERARAVAAGAARVEHVAGAARQRHRLAPASSAPSPTSSAGRSPFIDRPMSRPAICAGAASPRMITRHRAARPRRSSGPRGGRVFRSAR